MKEGDCCEKPPDSRNSSLRGRNGDARVRPVHDLSAMQIGRAGIDHPRRKTAHLHRQYRGLFKSHSRQGHERGKVMKTKLFAAWLAIPFAASIASDSGAPFNVIAWILLVWIVSALVWLELYRRHEEEKRQRRLDACRRQSRKAG